MRKKRSSHGQGNLWDAAHRDDMDVKRGGGMMPEVGTPARGQGGPAPLSRSTDPDTSADGERHIKKKLGSLHMEFLQRLQRRGRPQTANEIAAGNDSIRKRATELVTSGHLVRFGARHCNCTGKNATTYWLTSLGKAVLDG